MLLFLAACNPSTPPPTPTPATLHGVGSSVLGEGWPELESEFSARHPEIQIAFDATASALGVEEVADGLAAFAISTDPTAPDRYPELDFDLIGHVALAIIAQPDLELNAIAVEDLRQLFGGRVQSLPDERQTPVKLVSREEGSGERAIFEQTIMQEMPVSLAALIQPSDEAVTEYISRNDGAIGYARLNSLDESVQMLALDGIQPNQPDYPLILPVYLVLPNSPGPGGRALLEWLRSPAARRILEQTITPAP